MSTTMTITVDDAKRILAFSAQVDNLDRMREKKRITELQYINSLNELRGQCGLSPINRSGAQCREA